MPRPAKLSLVVLSCIGLAACSKKQEPTPPAPATPPAETAAVTPDAPAPSPREFDFSGKSSGVAPLTPPTAVKTGEPQASPNETVQVQLPVLVEYFPPPYPFSDRMKGNEGRVLVSLIVTEAGAVQSPAIVTSTVPAYAEGVLKAAENWRFIPAIAEGKPVGFRVNIPVSFVSEFGSGGMPTGSPLENLVLSGDSYYTVSPDGKFTLANLDVTLLTRADLKYVLPEGVNEVRATVKFKVDTEGRVTEPEIVDSSKTDFDQVALKSIRYWQFLPRLKNGKPTVAPAKLPLKVSRN